jgi:hypothetical protein
VNPSGRKSRANIIIGIFLPYHPGLILIPTDILTAPGMKGVIVPDKVINTAKDKLGKLDAETFAEAKSISM